MSYITAAPRARPARGGPRPAHGGARRPAGGARQWPRAGAPRPCPSFLLRKNNFCDDRQKRTSCRSPCFFPFVPDPRPSMEAGSGQLTRRGCEPPSLLLACSQPAPSPLPARSQPAPKAVLEHKAKAWVKVRLACYTGRPGQRVLVPRTACPLELHSGGVWIVPWTRTSCAAQLSICSYRLVPSLRTRGVSLFEPGVWPYAISMGAAAHCSAPK